MAYEFVKDRTGVSGTTLRDIACAMSPDGTTVYVAERPAGSSLGQIISMDWPNLDNETVVYSDPAGYTLTGVACTPSGPKAVMASHVDGSAEVRKFDETVIWTSPEGAPSTTAGGAVWNPVLGRLFVMFDGSTTNATLFSMLEDGSNVQSELSSGIFVSDRPRLSVTPDGAVWWMQTTTSTNNNSGSPQRWTNADGLDFGSSQNPQGLGVVVTPGSDTDVLTSFGSPFDTHRYGWNGSTVVLDAVTPPDTFDGYRIVHGATDASFRRGVAYGIEPDDLTGATVEDYRWWRFQTGRRFWVGSTGFSR